MTGVQTCALPICAATIQALADPTSTPATFGRPGHINPLYAQEKGVLRRAGHTEATIDMARLAGLYPAGALMEIMSEDGTMARLPELRQMADEHGLKLISIHDLIVYRLKQESIVEKGVEVNMPTEHGMFRLIPFRQKSNGLEHMAIFKGTWSEDEPILVRVHSSCATGDILGSQRCDCGEQLHKAMEMIEKEGKGVVVYLNQEGRGIGLMEKMKAYKLQEDGMDTVDANICLGHLADERDYGVGAQILRELGVHKMRLLTNNPVKRVGLEAYGLEIVENVPVETVPNPYIIKANLNLIFPGYDVDSSYCIKISRDADILIDDTASSADLVAQLKKKVKKRKIGDVCRFVYDRGMPHDFLDFLVDAFHIQRDELVPGDKHLNLEDLRHLPNPNKSLHSLEKPKPMKLTILDEKESIFNYVAKKDLLLYYPYHSFEHFIHFLYCALIVSVFWLLSVVRREVLVFRLLIVSSSAAI